MGSMMGFAVPVISVYGGGRIGFLSGRGVAQKEPAKKRRWRYVQEKSVGGCEKSNENALRLVF